MTIQNIDYLNYCGVDTLKAMDAKENVKGKGTFSTVAVTELLNIENGSFGLVVAFYLQVV